LLCNNLVAIKQTVVVLNAGASKHQQQYRGILQNIQAKKVQLVAMHGCVVAPVSNE
jgi:hypothetical protein